MKSETMQVEGKPLIPIERQSHETGGASLSDVALDFPDRVLERFEFQADYAILDALAGEHLDEPYFRGVVHVDASACLYIVAVDEQTVLSIQGFEVNRYRVAFLNRDGRWLKRERARTHLDGVGLGRRGHKG